MRNIASTHIIHTYAYIGRGPLYRIIDTYVDDNVYKWLKDADANRGLLSVDGIPFTRNTIHRCLRF